MDSFPGRSIEAELPRGLVMEVRLYLVRNRLYQIMVLCEQAKRAGSESRKLFDSFRLLKAPEDPSTLSPSERESAEAFLKSILQALREKNAPFLWDSIYSLSRIGYKWIAEEELQEAKKDPKESARLRERYGLDRDPATMTMEELRDAYFRQLVRESREDFTLVSVKKKGLGLVLVGERFRDGTLLRKDYELVLINEDGKGYLVSGFLW